MLKKVKKVALAYVGVWPKVRKVALACLMS